MRDRAKRNLAKALSVLGVLVMFGIAKTKAFGLATVGVITASLFGLSLFPGILEDMAVRVAQGIGGLLINVIQALGGVLFATTTGFLEMAMYLNGYIQDSPIVQDGFWVSLTIANLGLVVGIVVIAIATMVRAEWLVDPRQSIPKFITAALLINFGLFIGGNLVIRPVDMLSQTIFDASNISSNSFVGIFRPKLGVDSLVAAQINIAKLPKDDPESPGTAENIINYYLLRENQLATAIEDILRQHETASFFTDAYVPVGRLPNQDVVYVSDGSRRAVKEAVLTHTDRLLAFQDPERTSAGDGFGVAGNIIESVNTALYSTEDAFKNAIESSLDKGNAPYLFYAKDQSSLEGLVGAINDAIKVELAKENLPPIQSPSGNEASPEDQEYQDIGFGCELWSNSGSSQCQDLFVAVSKATAELDGLDQVSLILSEVLFYALFTFLGIFTLLTVAVLMFMRYVALSILLILFPFVWIGWIFPKIKGIGGVWKSWWSQFMKWLLFGPISLFFVYLSVQAATSRERLVPISADRIGHGSLATISASVGDMAIVIGLMIGGVIVANKMGVQGASLFYGGLKKMRAKAGQLAKRAVKSPYTNKYTQRGLEHMGSAISARWAGWRTRKDRTRAGRDNLDRLASSANPFTAWRGRNRQGRAARAEEILQKHYERQFMYRDKKGVLTHAPGGQRRSQMLASLVAKAENETKVLGKPRVDTLRSMAALQQTLHDDGFTWEAPYLKSSAILNKNGYYLAAGRQKMENQLNETGLAPAVMQAIYDNPQNHTGIVAAMQKEFGKIDTLKIDPKLLGDKPQFGMDSYQWASYQAALTEYITKHRPTDLTKVVNASSAAMRMKIQQAAQPELKRFEEDIMGAQVTLPTGQQVPLEQMPIPPATPGGNPISWIDASPQQKVKFIQDEISNNTAIGQTIQNNLQAIANRPNNPMSLPINAIYDIMLNLDRASRAGLGSWFVPTP